MKNWSLARRDLLKSLGAGAACLPLLRAGKAFGQAAANRHFIVLQMSEGLRQGAWKPATGALGMLPKSNAPFEPHKADMIFIPGLNNPGGGGGHGSYGCVYYGLGRREVATEEPSFKVLAQVFEQSGFNIRDMLVAFTKTRAFTHRALTAGEAQ